MSRASDIPLEPVCNLLWQTSDLILEVYERPFKVQYKTDQSPVTEADLRAHQLLEQGLARLTPGIPVLSEESKLTTWETRQSWPEYWLIDPLDGTKEFIAGNGEFTVNLALIEANQPVLGLVAVPAQARIYLGLPEQSLCYVVDEHGQKRDLRCRRMDELEASGEKAHAKVQVVATRTHSNARMESLLAQLKQRLPGLETRAVGSALKLCLLAQGEADLYPRLAPTSEWDIAAAHAVLIAAGGEVFTLDGAPMRYNTKESLLNPDFIAVADPGYDWQALIAPALLAAGD